MNTNITNMTVDLSTANNFGVIRAVQGDMRTRFVYITLLDNQVEYVFDKVYPVLRGTKPDGTTIFNVCSISDDNKIIVELSEQLLATPGKITCEISLYSVPEQISEDKQVITSFPFTIFVSTAAFAPDAVTSTDEFTAIADVIGNNAVLQECLDDIVASRDAAKVSEVNAKKSEDATAISKEAAKESEIAAKASETNAAQSEENASTSATNAANSAATAASKATEASDSASAAKISETNAKVSETKAESSQTAAADSAASAETSENHAAQSADSAAESAAISAQKASAAALSATDAADSADLASQKAAEAADSALAASQEAMAAANAAASITDSAATAALKATEAIDHAVKAESFTHGGTNTRENEDIDNAEYYYHQSKAISESMSGALRPIGTVAFADLPALSSATEGDMYNISDQFTTNADFREGTGFEIAAGSNIYKTADGKWDVLAGSPVTGVKGTAETSYRKGNVNITKENIGLGNVPNVSTNDQTPTFAQAEIRENIASGEKLSALLGKIKKFFSDLKTVAFTGSYSDLTNKPAIGNGTVTIEQAGVEKGTFTMNQSENVTIELTDTNPVTSVNGQIGNVQITAEDLGALTEAPVTSVNGQTGNVTITEVTGGAGYATYAKAVFDNVLKMYNNQMGVYIHAPNEYNLVIGVNGSGAFNIRNDKVTKSIFPAPSKTYSLGFGSFLWKDIYADNSVIQTSDEAKKCNIVGLDDDLTYNFIMGLIPISYKMVDGDSGRTHYGMGAQSVEKVMESLGMSSLDFAGFIKSPRINIENGESEIIDGEYDYGLRYSEFISPLIKMVQIQEQKIQEIKKELEEIRSSFVNKNDVSS